MELVARPGMLIIHPSYGKGTIVKVETTFYTIHFPNRGNMDISKRTEDLEILEPESNSPSNDEEFSMSHMEKTLQKVSMS